MLLGIGGGSLSAQYHLSPDAPKNPVPIQFHKDHFFLRGPVKEYKKMMTGDVPYTTWYFNRQGYLLKEHSTFSGRKTHYFYKNGNLQKIIAELSVNLHYEITLDEHGRPVMKKYISGGEVRDIKKYEYDAHGNFVREYDFGDSIQKLYFSQQNEYDRHDRVTRIRYFRENGEVFKTLEYTYKKAGDAVMVTTTDKHSGRSRTYSNYYLNGVYCASQKDFDIKLDAHHNPTHIEGRLGDMPLVYAYYPSATHTCTEGNCQDGWGTATFEDGSYTGFWRDGMRHGHGAFAWTSGATYIGHWAYDEMDGLGIYSETTQITIGEFSGSDLHGLGIIMIDNAAETPGLFSNGERIITYLNFGTGLETGCISGDCTEGYGSYKWDNGNVFTGFWRASTMHMGVYQFANGDAYIGYVSTDRLPHGFGIYRSKSAGIFYAGEWQEGKYHGKGYLQQSSGQEQAGLWEHGKLVRSMKE